MAEMQITRNIMWSSSLFDVSVPDVDNAGLMKFVEENKKKEVGVERSNVGGWQFDVGYNYCKPLDDLLDKLAHAATHIWNDVYRIEEELVIANCWFNSNEFGQGNAMHTHPGAQMSGVYYINVEEGSDNGVINLQREGDHSIEQHITMTEASRAYSHAPRDHEWVTTFALPPQQSHAYLFSAWQRHEVRRNLQDYNRVALAFNFIPWDKRINR